MNDVLNCDGMTAEQARAALRAHCRAQEAARKAERDKRAEHRRANAERLGITGGSPTRPKRYPARHGWQKLTHNGEPATGVLYASEWRCFETGWPYKLLTFVAVVRRHRCYKWQIQLEGEDLTKETAWLEASDIDMITGAKIHFRNGFTLESRDGIAVAVSRRMTEAEIQAEAVILDVAEGMEHKPLTAAQRGARAKGGPTTKRRQPVTLLEAAQLCNVTEKTIRRWEKGEATPEDYPGRGDAVVLGAWAARRKEAANIKRGLTKMTIVRDMDRATQKKQYSDWQAETRRRGATGYRSSDY